MLAIQLLVLINESLVLFQTKVVGNLTSILLKIGEQLIEVFFWNLENDICIHLEQPAVAVVGKSHIGFGSQGLGSQIIQSQV